MSLRYAPLALALAVTAVWSPRAQALAGWEETAGDVLTGVVPVGAYFITRYHDDTEGRQQWFWSTGTTLVINTALRVALNDTEWGTRPNGHSYGFPSGHIGFIASGAAFLQERYGYRYGIPAWAATAYTAYVRVETRHHRWRDTIAGAALAYGVSRFLVTPLPAEASVTPMLDDDGFGVNVSFNW